MQCSLHYFYINCLKDEDAMDTIKKIDKNYEIYGHKIINLATLLVRKNRIEDAFNLLKNQQKKRKSSQEFNGQD